MKQPLVHYSASPLKRVLDVSQAADGRGLGFKPSGLWFSVGDEDDGWRAWCEDQNFGADRFAYAVEIVLVEDANILRLKGAEEIDNFTAAYGKSGGTIYDIDWAKVASLYDGMIIAPYCWARRLHRETSWYYAWDCASGCIWRSRAILELREMPSPNAFVLSKAGVR